MAPRELIIGLVVAVLAFFTVMDSVKNPEKPKKHYRSFKSPVVSNAELFDAFNSNDNQEEMKESKDENN